MSRIKQTKTNFAAGEISKKLLGRGDLRAYENGALSLKNIYIHPTGGISRRFGTYYVGKAKGMGRLVNFEFNTEQTYLLVFTALNIDVYKEDTLVASIVTTYTADQIKTLSWTQNADTLILCQKDTQPKILTRTSHTSWTLSNFDYEIEDSQTSFPRVRLAGPNAVLTPSAATGTITLTCSEGIFKSTHLGSRFNLNGGQVRVTVFTNNKTVSCTVLKNLTATTATTRWTEEAFSIARGWPSSVSFHQSRLVFGGSRDAPNYLWFSKSNNIFSFNEGTGLDNEAIVFGIVSDQVNAVTNLFSGRHLQVFTSGAEWMVTGEPLTPQNVQVKRQTRIGSTIDQNIPPVDIDGATVFAARNGKELREFLYTDVEAAYKATDLSLLAQHIINKPVDQAFDAKKRLLYAIMSNGTVGVLTAYRDEAVVAWTLFETQGTFKSISIVAETIYFLVERTNGIYIEKFTEDNYLDAALKGTSVTPKAVWSGMPHLNGMQISILADGCVHPNKTVSSGTVTLDYPVRNIQVGLAYTHKVEPLPPSILSPTGKARAARLVEAIFRVEETSSLYLDVGRGLIDILVSEQPPGLAPLPRSGDKSIRASGWTKDMTKPLWKIEQSVPLPFSLLSVTTETKVSE